MDPSSPNKSMDQEPNPDPHNLPPLKCPRCDSSNTKFCYYNNYSLSQPRHFCKACKRYWTRGGTLRNVPVGGGCRKNKRVKRPTPGGDGVSSAVTSHVPPPLIDRSYNSLQSTNPLELNFPFSRLSSSSGFDFHQPDSFGLGFSSAGQNFNDPSVFLRSANSSGSTSTMASLLASLQQQRFGTSGLMPYDHDYQGRGGNGISNEREVKMEDESNKLDDKYQNNQVLHHDEQINSSSHDANDSSLIWNTSSIGSWFDPNSNTMGSSVPSLI